MHIVAVIPARKGSRRVPDKNIRLLGGQPLMAWTIETALAVKSIDRVIVSTDSEKYAKIAKEYGAEVPFLRPAEISTDCDTATVAKHCVRYLEKNESYHTTHVVTLQPTSPFRTAKETEAAVDLMFYPNYADSIVSVTPISEHPAWMFQIDCKHLKSFLGFPPRILSGLIAQELPKLYLPNGAIYVTPRSVIEQERIYGDKIGFVLMSKEHSLDLETEADFKLAEAMLNVGNTK